MVEIIVISENNTAAEMLKTVQKVLGAGAVKRVRPLVVKSSYSKAKVCGLIRGHIASGRGKTDGVLILTEVFGSTQSNLCLDLLNEKGVCLISGYNLPMLIKAATLNQTSPLKKLAAEVEAVGKKYIQTFCGEGRQSIRKLASPARRLAS